MTRLFVSALAAFVFSFSAAQAQSAPTAIAQEAQKAQAAPVVKDAATRAKNTAQRMATSLSLTGAQAEQVEAILLSQFQRMDELKASGNMKGGARQIRQEADKAIEGVIGADKYAQWQKIRQEQKEARKAGKM